MYAQHKGAASAKEGEVSVITFTAEFRKELRDAKGPVIVDWTASWLVVKLSIFCPKHQD